VNCCDRFEGLYSSNELPHFIKDMAYAYDGAPELGRLIAERARAKGLSARAHEIPSLELEYGTLVPMRYMNADQTFKVVSVAAWCEWHSLENSRRFGEAVREAIEASDATVGVLASGSLSHRFNDDGSPEEAMFQISREFNRQVDLHVVDLWRKGDFATFTRMLPDYAELCHGEGGMHDTAMLLGVLGWDAYDRPVEVVTDYFPSSGTGQINAIFPVS
jgi:3,4-dihydroxyphenylacetate 2,3-dioxygenase